MQSAPFGWSIFPEPAQDIHAQVSALASPSNPKDAVFIAHGSPMPSHLPPGIMRVPGHGGELLTTNPAKAAEFAHGNGDHAAMARVLGYPEHKGQIGPDPRVVQARNANGHVVYEAATSPQGVGATWNAAQAQMPAGGQMAVLSPMQAIMRRAAMNAGNAR